MFRLLWMSVTPIFCFILREYLFLKDKNITRWFLVKIRDVISKYSYGIFLAHVLVFSPEEYGINWNFINPIIGIPLTVLICLVITLFSATWIACSNSFVVHFCWVQHLLFWHLIWRNWKIILKNLVQT